VIGGKRSIIIKCSSGVPQGSHLGPWIFIIFINDIVNVIKNSHILMFADDLKIFRIIDNPSDLQLLQDDINNLCKWCVVRKLDLNIKKCKSMSFHRRSLPHNFTHNISNVLLEQITETKDLGVTFTENIPFNKHIDIIISKANSMFGFMKRWTKDIYDTHCILTIYFAYIRSQVEYAVPVWNPYYKTHIDRIETIQKKFLIHLYFKCGGEYDSNIPFYENISRIPSYNDRCSEHKILTLNDRRKFLASCFVFNIIKGLTDSSFILENINFQVPTRQLRHQTFLKIQHHRTNYGANEPINNISNSFNEVSHLFDFTDTRHGFKTKLKDFYLDLSIT
jgi:hypothetical protein